MHAGRERGLEFSSNSTYNLPKIGQTIVGIIAQNRFESGYKYRMTTHCRLPSAHTRYTHAMPAKHVSTPICKESALRKEAPANIKKQAAKSKKRSVLVAQMSQREKTKRSLEEAFGSPEVRAAARKALEALTRF